MKKFIIGFFLMFMLVGICADLTFPHKATISDTNENEKNGYVVFLYGITMPTACPGNPDWISSTSAIQLSL